MKFISYDDLVEFSELKGKIVIDIVLQNGVHDDGDEIIFKCKSGWYIMLHCQDCCESVTLEDFDLESAKQTLIGSEIIQANELKSSELPPKKGNKPDSYTWTFYRLATIKGWVDIRWYGTSNGYYSESVELYHVPAEVSEEEFWEQIQSQNGTKYCMMCNYNGKCIPYTETYMGQEEDSFCYQFKEKLMER
jgi:hypothetical protein